MMDMEIESLLSTMIRKVKNDIRDCKQADSSDSLIWDEHIHHKKEKEWIQLQEELNGLKENNPLEKNSTKFKEAEELLEELHNNLRDYSIQFNK